jgi:hypothetical protein
VAGQEGGTLLLQMGHYFVKLLGAVFSILRVEILVVPEYGRYAAEAFYLGKNGG